jgi:hypothetical protein
LARLINYYTFTERQVHSNSVRPAQASTHCQALFKLSRSHQPHYTTCQSLFKTIWSEAQIKLFWLLSAVYRLAYMLAGGNQVLNDAASICQLTKRTMTFRPESAFFFAQEFTLNPEQVFFCTNVQSSLNSYLKWFCFVLKNGVNPELVVEVMDALYARPNPVLFYV